MTRAIDDSRLTSVWRYGGRAILVLAAVAAVFGVLILLAHLRAFGTWGGVEPLLLRAPFWGAAGAVVWLVAFVGSCAFVVLSHGPASAWLAIPHVVGAVLALGADRVNVVVWAGFSVGSLLTVLVAHKLLVALVSWLLGTAGVCAMLVLVGEAGRAGAYATVSVVVGLFVVWTRMEAQEWIRQYEMYSQARWAASEFISVNVRMQDGIDRAAGTTRVRERVRVAREIHDTVGYTLTAVLMQIQAASEVHRAKPSELPGRLRNLETMVRESIQDVRREVSNLRDESVVAKAGNSRWQRLCSAFADGTGIRVYVDLSDDLEQVSTEVSEHVYRILQESLTNAYRHGGADYVDIRMEWRADPGRILLRVSDNGKGASLVRPGNGLTGIRERVAELNGEVEWRTSPGQGFDLGIVLPWEVTN